MIYSLKSSFFKTEILFDRVYMSYLETLLLDGEEIIKSISPYKSCEVIAWFTNKRIIFTSSPVEVCTPGKTTEIEFLPYKSIQRYSLLDGNTSNSFKLELFLSDRINISFFMTNTDDTMKIMEVIGGKINN